MYCDHIEKKYPLSNNDNINNEYSNILINISNIIDDINYKIINNNIEIESLSKMLIENIQIYHNILFLNSSSHTF